MEAELRTNTLMGLTTDRTNWPVTEYIYLSMYFMGDIYIYIYVCTYLYIYIYIGILSSTEAHVTYQETHTNCGTEEASDYAALS